jgi:hypothetical protein
MSAPCNSNRKGDKNVNWIFQSGCRSNSVFIVRHFLAEIDLTGAWVARTVSAVVRMVASNGQRRRRGVAIATDSEHG